jgi:hypothetical protein
LAVKALHVYLDRRQKEVFTMLAQPTQKRVHRLAAARPDPCRRVRRVSGLARVATNTIDPVAVVPDNGRHLVVTGPFTCTARERAYLLMTVTQRTTGAVAEGSGFITCTGVNQQWEVHALTQGAASFAPGAATAVGLGTTSYRGQVTDAHQWLVNITLVEE